MTETLLPELEDPEGRKAVIDAVFALFARWSIHEIYQASLVGVTSMSELKRYRLPADDISVFERIGHLLAIDRALAKRYPYQYTARDEWISSSQEQLDHRIPLDIMLNQGLEGIKNVRQVAEGEQ